MRDAGAEDQRPTQAGQHSPLDLFLTGDGEEIVPIRRDPQPGIMSAERLLGEGVHTENYSAGDGENPGDFYRVIRLSEEEFIGEGPELFQENFARRTEDLVEEALAIHRLNPSGEIAGMAQLLEVGVAGDERVFSDAEGREYVYKDCRVYFKYRGIAGGRALSAPEAKGLTLRERVEIMILAADAVAEVHARSWVHGDIKPDNVLWSRDDAGGLLAMLIDFNSVREGMQLTSDSPLYAATRDCVIVGGRRIVHPRIDIAAFGRTMVEFLLGLAFLPHDDDVPFDDDELHRNLDYWLNRAETEEIEGELRRRGYGVAVPFVRLARSMSDPDIGKRPQAISDVAARLRSMLRRAGGRLDRVVSMGNLLCGDPEALLRRAELRGHIRETGVSGSARGEFAGFLRCHMGGDAITVYEFAGLGRAAVEGVTACELGVCVIDLRMGFSLYRTGELDDLAIEALFDPESPGRMRCVVRRCSGVRALEAFRAFFVRWGDYFRQVSFWWRRLWRLRVAGSARVPIKARRVRKRGR
ncbi:MAG: hypothetical protein IT577_18755 [Verrucomicrobiae bacterium]|nr:hypothetical protein [Verrucomicrobiae bacterium]